MESYRELFDAKDDKVVLRYIWVLSHDVVKGHWRCPCGGKAIRNCHKDQIRELHSKIAPELVRLRFKQLEGLKDKASEAMFDGR